MLLECVMLCLKKIAGFTANFTATDHRNTFNHLGIPNLLSKNNLKTTVKQRLNRSAP